MEPVEIDKVVINTGHWRISDKSTKFRKLIEGLPSDFWNLDSSYRNWILDILEFFAKKNFGGKPRTIYIYKICFKLTGLKDFENRYPLTYRMTGSYNKLENQIYEYLQIPF